MTKIIQISDTHIVPKGELAYGKVDTGAALVETVKTINCLLPQFGPVDLAIATGDLVEYGTAAEYQLFRQIMESLAIPYRAVPGNHDNRETMRAVFSDQDWMPAAGPINWVAELDDFAVIGLDTNVPDARHGHLIPASLDFLEGSLARLADKPVLLGIHHPPFATGIAAMDAQNLIDSDRLREILSAHPSEVRLLCGHVHRNVVTSFGKAVCMIAPGTSHAVTLDQRADNINSLTCEPGGFMLHEWREGLVSHTIAVGAFEGPHPFYPEE